MVDCYYYRAGTKFAVKLPADPASLHLETPYPGRTATWFPGYREWAWFVPSLADLPDVTPAFELALPLPSPRRLGRSTLRRAPFRRHHPPDRVRREPAPGDGRTP